MKPYYGNTKYEGQMKHLTSSNTASTTASKQRKHLEPCICRNFLDYDLEVIENGYSGADNSSISTENLRRCTYSNVYDQGLPLLEIIKIQLSLSQGKIVRRIIHAKKEARISITPFTGNGTLNFINADFFLVFVHPMN